MTHMHLMVQIEAGCDPTVKIQPQWLCDNLYKLLIFNEIKSFMNLIISVQLQNSYFLSTHII